MLVQVNLLFLTVWMVTLDWLEGQQLLKEE